MQWYQEYYIGVPEIDKQHQQLIQAVNRVSDIYREKDNERNRRICIEAIKYLKSYTLNHFSDEEAFQRSIGYEDYENHKKIHDDFVQTVIEYEKILQEQNYSSESVQKFISICSKWISYHILNKDQKIVEKPPVSLSSLH